MKADDYPEFVWDETKVPNYESSEVQIFDTQNLISDPGLTVDLDADKKDAEVQWQELL